MTDMLSVLETCVVIVWLWAINGQLARIADALERPGVRRRHNHGLKPHIERSEDV